MADDLTVSSNWGRWGQADDRGTTNLIDEGSLVRAARLVRTGIRISLAHELALEVAENNPNPASRSMKTRTHLDGGAATDTISVDYHGLATTHLDALCHVWDSHGMYNGRSPEAVIQDDGARWGDVTVWRDGIITRALLLDLCRFRGVDCVVIEEPVTGDELKAAVAATGMSIEPGDALVVYSGRERWDQYSGHAWGAERMRDGISPRPGLHPSCVDFLRESDCGVLVWDMMDALPTDLEVAWPVHRVIHELGMPIIDNARLGPLARHCQTSAIYEFMLVVAPLVVPGGTGSPVNPLALF